jgi:hypothetical protein
VATVKGGVAAEDEELLLSPTILIYSQSSWTQQMAGRGGGYGGVV